MIRTVEIPARRLDKNIKMSLKYFMGNGKDLADLLCPVDGFKTR